MAGDKFDQLYNALKADGAVSETREHFRQFVYAPGKQGYHNRKQLYDALHADGAVSSSSYEEFAQRFGLHAVNPKPQQQKPVQPVKKLTMKQRAQEVAAQYRKPRQQKAQQPRTATASGTDYMQNWRLMHMRNDQMTPLQQAQASNARARMQRAQEQSARQEQQRATPISRSRITPAAKNFNETMQQLSTPETKQARAKQQREDDARAFAQYEVEGNKFVRNDGQTEGILGNDLLELVDSSMNEAQELTRQQYQQNLDKMGGIYAPQSVKEQAFRDAQTQEQVNRQNVLMNNLSSKINEIYSQKGMQRHIAESADKLNMSVEEYVDKYVTPEIMNYAQKALTMRNQEEIMPHGALDYIAKNLSNSIIGMVVAPSVMSRDTRQRLQEGIAIADGDAEIQKVAGHKDETYRSGIGTRFASTAVNMAADSGPLAVIGAGASAAVNTGTRVLTNGLVKAGVMKAAQKLTAQQMAFKVANMTTAQKIMSGLGTRTATGALNLAGYSGVTAALNQASTGDDTSLQAIGEAGLKGAEHGAVTGAMFGISGAIMSPWVSKFGITGMEKSTGERLLHGAQKFGATAAGLGVEAGTMMVADNVTGDKDISFGTWLEDVVMVCAFKAGEPSNFVKMGNILHHLTHNSGGNFVIGKNANGSPIAVDIRLTPDEKNELISSASGKNLMDAFVKVDRASKTAPRDPKYKTAYTDFMNDPDVSQSTKEKVNAAMGLFNTTRGKSYRSVNDVKNKQILEYTKNGTLLTRTSYKNADERRAILYKQKLYRDNDDMMSLMGYARMKDMQFIDDDGTVTNLAFRFLKENGYDENKDITDPNNARLINDLRNQKSALYLDWTKYADKNGLLGYLRSESKGYTNNFMASIKELLGKEGSIVIDIDKIMRKDPMKRTDEENRIFYHVKRALEDELFPSWRPHADQSASQGKTVAEEHSLGTDNPDSGVVVDELRNLRNAEQALDAAMDSNDVFKQTFEQLHQQGLTPAQIYDALIQNGLIQEELTPLAQYINANARVQGMQQATADAIEENVKSFISDWSYHGTLNGQAMNGEQALYVQDSSGRTLLVGSGDVAFDQTTGRAKEGSGDMLVCLDPNTKEMVYVKADEVTLLQNQPIDQFAAEYRQRLQMKNSEPYNQAAQEQAMQDAAKAQQEVQPKENKNEEISNNETDGKIRKGDNANSGSDGEAEENASEGDASVQQVEQPQQTRKFADGSDVPMATDSKGRPTPDYEKMTPEQSAEILTEDFGENAEKVVDGQIKKAENALKDAEKMKVDYTAEPNDIMEQEALKTKTVEAAKQQLEHAQNIKKTMTAKKVAETVGKTEQTEGAHEAGSVAAQKFVNAPRLVGNKRTRMLPDGETKIKGHYEIVPAESLTPSHDVNNDYKKSEGFPTDAEGRTVNDRDYEHDKAAQQNTDQIARKYNGMAIEQVPVVSDEGIVYDGNGRTMAGQKAAKEGTDSEYINDLLENAENFGFTREQIEQSGIEHPRLVLVTDERLPYDAATFAKFNRNEKKTQSNTEQAVAKAKTLTADEVGAIVAEIEGNGSLDAFFNNSKAINDLVKTLVDKGIIGQNEVAQMMDTPERLSAQGREYVKNLLLGSIFKPESIRMLGIDSTVKNKAINAIRSVMDNMKLGEFSLRDEIDQAIQLLYEARQGGNKVDTLLRTPSMFGEDAAKRYPSISQMMALALEGKVSDFRDLLDEYNRIAKARNTGEGNMFEAAPTKEELINEYLNFKKWQDYGTGHSENEGGNDVSGNEEPQQEASGENEPAEAERPRVEEADDLENKELESRIEVTDEETETPSKNGPIMKQKILIDGDKEVIKVDEPNDKGEYTGSYYEYDGKKFGDLKEVADYIDSKKEEGPLPLLPKEENPDPTFDPIAAAAAEFKKEHPLTEDEIMKADVDDLSKDMALDYLNGEVTDDLHRAIYESIFAKTRGQKTEPKVETPKAESSADPMEGIKNAAEAFGKEKKTKAETEKKTQQKADDAAVAASNKKVNDLWDMLKNAGKDEISASFVGLNSRQLETLPKLVSAMAENAYLRIKRGMHNLEDVVKEMRKEFAPAAKLFKKEDVDTIYEHMMNIRYRDGEQRMSLKDWADYYEKTSPKHQENLADDSKTAEERKLAEKKFIDTVNLQLGFKHKFNGIVELRKIAERVGLKDINDTDIQELAETAIVKRARGIASSESTNDAVKFVRIKTLYENQPSLNQRDSERVMKQQYSTPAPYAFLADMYVKGNGKVIESALEPSAGNGMLTIGLPMDKVHVNDIDAQRLANLRRQGFKNVTSQDGTQPFADKDVDVVVTNPPFGSATPKEYDGYKISSLEGQMAINALESMKDDGRAAIIIGGKTEYAKNGSLNPKDKAFLGYLYSHYNVEDVINVDGSLYAKQGTSYPTRIILINGRRLNENAFPPVKDKARAETVKDYNELYKRIEDDILRGERMDSSIGGPRGQLQRVDKSVRGLSTEKVTYTPKSVNPFTLKAVMPADQQEAVNKNLEKLGDVDQFLVDELGYNDKDDLYSHLAAEQVDSVALALQQAKKGNAFIIGDMTGIGKGRQAASLIRYAKKHGQVPVYFTKTAGLLSGVYRDLVDIGSPDLRPFVFGSAKEAAITDSDGKVVFALPSKSEVKRVLDYIEKNGKLPDEYDYVLATYSQVSNGVNEFDEDGNRKERKLAKGKSFGAAALSGLKRRDAIEKLMGNAYLILDESHTASGNSGQGNYFQHIIQKAKNVTFFSATFAKRPDNMPIYALRTAMNEGGMKSSDLIDAVKRGGATLQEIMSQTLTQCGQMIRRERDMTGVTIDWKAIDDPERVQEQREQYDSIIGLFNDIINFQKKYVSSYVDERNDELAAIQSTMGNKNGTAALGIKNQPFASKAFNTVQQVLLSLKAKSAAERAIDYLKQGMKPVIALNNTNESQTGNLALGEEMDAPDLGTSLKKGLEGTLRYTQKDANDNSESGYIKLSDLGDEAVEAYHELEKKIEQTSTGLSLSPIDVIKNELQKAGYKVGELTGRQTEFVYNDNGTVTKVKRADTDKKKLARDFNDGKIDALILNKSAATGISLHASSKYKDQKKRVMIVAQQQLDVNDEVQMRGRIDRTGQVARGAYEYVVSLIPAEQRLLMMFKAKLKSLDANTTSSQKSKFNEMEVADITNKYGDKVVREYMAEHLDLYARMTDPFGWEKSNGDDLSRIDPQTLVASGGGVGDGEAGADASKLLGRMALLRVSEQEKMLQEIGELYANEIQRLNEMGENDLEITELPLKAKTLRKEVWKQGAEPGGDNAFADNTYIEKVNMAILKKPMKASEVKASQDGLTGGKTWDEYKTDKKAAVKEYFDQKIADETQKYEERAVKAATKAKEKYIKDGKKGQKDSGMSDEQIEKMAGYQYDNIYKQEKDKLNDVMKNLKAKAEMFERVLDTFDTNQTFVLPTDMNNPNELSGFSNSYGRLIDIKITDNYSPNASSVSFATLDGRRKITFPIAGKVGSGENKVDIIGSIDRMTKQAAGMGDSHLRVLNQNFDNWDRLTSNESRKNGYIVTGNLMQALVDSKDQGLGGQLVKYTTDTGEVKTGILMPDRFDPKGLTTDAPINSVTEKFELSSWHGGIDEVTSSDGEVKVKRIDNNRGNFYELRVPKSKTNGGKYFMDEDLLKLVNGNNFETRGNNMLAEFKPEQLKPVLDRLSKMGVKVQEERKTSEDEGTHFREDRGLQYSKTDTKDVKNSRIIPEDVDKNVSSQIEKKFDDRVDELTKDLSNEDKAEFNRHLDYYTSEFSRYKASEITYTLNGLEDEVRFWGRTFGNREKAGRTHLVQLKRAELEAAKTAARREMDYREVRAKALADGYGLRRGAKASFADISRLFEATNQAKEEGTRRLFEKARDIAKRLGVEFGGMDEGDERGNVGEATPERNINLFIDTLSRTYTNPKEAAHTILHELIHQATMGAIHLVKDGKAEGMLTPKQIEAVKTVIDIYNKVKADGRIVWEEGKRRNYGGKDEYEFAAEMAGGKQRKILGLSLGERIMNAVNELRNRGDNSLWQAVKNAWHKLFEISDKSKMDKALNDIMDDFNENIDDIAMNDIEENGYAYRVTDKDELDRLNKEKTFRMYSGMQEVDGKLYSPMAAIIDGKRTDATEIGAWMGADERPDLVKNGKFTLVKTDKNKGVGEGDVPAAYNPYMHTSTSMMNDQFTGAYARGNIKVVEWEIPESEKTSGYHAEGAKDVVGLVPWHSGSVNSLLPKDRQRQVMLSRWRKAVRVVPDSEVAESIAEQLKGTGLAIPWNVVTPNQVRELAKLGVPITTVESGRQAPETKEKFLQQMAELEQEFPQAKFVNVKMTKDAFKEWGKDGGTKFRTDHGGGNYPTSSVESHIEKVAQKTGAKVNMVSSVDEITNKAAKAAIEDGRKITGWYDEKTGEVHLYMPNIHDRYTAEKTIWHEVVGHKGMRELFGDERFDKFLREVWYDLDKPENAALKKLVDEERKFNPLNIYDAIEEGIARLAEDGKGEPGFWNGIKNKVSDFLHEIGYRVAPNTKDVKYLLWLSKNLQKNPNDPYWKLRAEAVKYRLDHERMPAVVAHDGMFYGNDGKVRSMDNLTKAEWNEATDGEIHFRTTPSAGTALDRYHRSLDEHGYMLTESYMDNMLSLKKLMNAIVPDKKIEDIASSENPYILQNTMQGAMSDAAQMFERNVMKPLDKAMADVLDAFDGKKDDEKIRNFNLYMITKHGLERNRILYVRDALKYMRMNEKTKKLADTVELDWNNEKATLDDKLERGDIDLKTYYKSMDDFIRTYVDSDNKFDAGEHDYSGIHAIQEVAKSSDPYDDAEAIASVMDSEAKMESIKKGSVKDYWDKVKAATQYSIDTDYKNGLISRELYGHVSDMFNWYVPLRKYDEATAEDTYGYITEQGDPKSYIGSTIMRARGHKYLSETNVLAQIGAMGNRAIKNGGMNAIRQAFARFVRNNSNNNLVTETIVWYADDPITHTTVERYPDIPEDATADEINQIVADFNMEMKDLESKGLATKVYRRGRIGYKFQRAENKSQHIVDVKIAGRTHSFIINGNPRAAQALNGLLENSGAKGIMKPLSSISRMMAQLCTSYNPEFVMRNIMRDAEFASSNVTSKEGARYGALWAKYYAQLGLYKGASNINFKDLSGTTGLGLFAKYRNGTLDTSDKVQRYFKEFMENGGETGWVQIKNMQDWTKEYKKDVKSERSKIDKGGAALRDFFFGNLANINEVAENVARFATYCASRDSNRSIIRSVYDAKEVSTNFNRHGSGDAIKSFKNGEMTGGKAAARWAYGFTASYLRHCSMFFNAGIQSTNLLVKNLKNHPVGTSINMLAIPFALGALAALGNNVLIASEDEKDRKGVKDPYGELPDYVRRNNLCIYKGGGQFVTIPLAIELRAFYGLGDLAAGLTFSPNVSGQKNPALDAVGCMSQLVPVMDYLGNSSAGKEPLNEAIKAISPSALSPFVEWELNTDWKGAPIERRGDWNENSPAWQRAYKGVPDGYMAVNKWVNAQTNDVAKGNEDMLGNSFLDMVTNPSMLNHYIGGIGGGAATFTERAIGVIKHGKDTETKDIPFLRSLLYTPSEQSSLQRTKSKWYNYKDEMEKTMANVDRLKSKNVPIDKRITNIGEYFHFQNSKEAAKVRIIELAEKQMKRWKKLRDKSSDTESINFANQNIDRIMMDAVDELDRLE